MRILIVLLLLATTLLYGCAEKKAAPYYPTPTPPIYTIKDLGGKRVLEGRTTYFDESTSPSTVTTTWVDSLILDFKPSTNVITEGANNEQYNSSVHCIAFNHNGDWVHYTHTYSKTHYKIIHHNTQTNEVAFYTIETIEDTLHQHAPKTIQGEYWQKKP